MNLNEIFFVFAFINLIKKFNGIKNSAKVDECE